MSGTVNLTIEQGSTFSRLITIQDESQTPVNITGNTFAGQIRKRHASDTVEATFTCTVTDGAAGKLTVALTDEQTAAIPSGDWVYDIEWYNGTVTGRLLEGSVYVSPEVTR